MENTVHTVNVKKNKEDPNGNDTKSHGSQLNNSKPPGEQPKIKVSRRARRKNKSKIRQNEVQSLVVEKTKTKEIHVDPNASTVKCTKKKEPNNKNKSNQPAVNITPQQGKVHGSGTDQVQNAKKRSSPVKAKRLAESASVAATNEKQDESAGDCYTDVEREDSPVMTTMCNPLWYTRKTGPVKTQKLTRSMKNMHIRIRKMNEKLKAVTKKQKEINRRMRSYETTPMDHGMIVSEVCRLIEPTLKIMVDRTTDEAYTDFETTFKHKLTVMQKTFSEIDSRHVSEMLDTNMFAKSLNQPFPKSHSLELILRELFWTVVIPKIQDAYWSLHEEILKVFDDLCSGRLLQDQLLIKRSKFVDYAKKFLDGGHFVEAFDMALTTLDMELVLNVCETITIPPQELFQFVSMKKYILLPLMQKLCIDLSNSTELKYKYLEATVINFDYADYSHKKNIKYILTNVDKEIELFLIQDPNNPYCCKIEQLQLDIKRKIHSAA